MSTAYSYLRFSSPEQAQGDSIRRQTAARDEWLKRNPDAKLDTSLKMTDAGRSAFARTEESFATYALGAFVAHIRSGRVKKGSYLLVENLDRLSREHVRTAVKLFIDLLDLGINIVTLSPEKVFKHDSTDMTDIIIAVIELSRGHSESVVKSERIGAAWAKKLKDAGKKPISKHTPGWIKNVEGKLVLRREEAKIVQRIYAMAIGGHSTLAIAKKLNAEEVPVLARKTMKGRVVTWAATTVRHILQTRAAMGEYIPYASDGKKPDGEAVKGYYPAVVDEATWRAAQTAITRRAEVGRGRKGKHVNLFSGLLHDARTNGPMTYAHSATACRLCPTAGIHGANVKWSSFPAGVFETAILGRLEEVTAKDLEDTSDATQKIEVLEGRLKDVNAALAVWTEKMSDTSIVEIVAKKLGEFNTEKKKLAEELETAKRELASPVAEAIDELHSLLSVLAKDNSDENRTKVRALLRATISRVVVAFGLQGRTQVANVRVEFATREVFREYVIVFKPNHPVFVRSGAAPTNKTLEINFTELERQYREHFSRK